MQIKSNLTQQEEAQLKNQMVNINAIPLKFVFFDDYKSKTGMFSKLYHFELISFKRTENELILNFSREEIKKIDKTTEIKTLFDL